MTHSKARFRPARPTFRRLCVLMLLVAGTAAGLVPSERAAAQEMDSVQVARYQLADSFLRAGQFDRSIALLEDLLEQSPDNYAFYSKLKEAYESVKRYDDAIALIRTHMGGTQTPSLLSDMARIYYLKDDEETAYATWDEAVALRPSDPNTYRIVYQSLLDVRQFERAIEILNEARAATDNEQLFQPDLAYLYSLTGRHDRAIQEYLGMLASGRQQLGFVRSRLSRFIEQDEALRASISAAERAVRGDPLNRGYRELLGWLYVEAEDYTNALDAYRAIDRLESEDGQVLFQFAQMASDAAAYDIAAQAYQEILNRYPDSPSAPQALAALGEMHERWAEQIDERVFNENGERIPATHYDGAVETYRSFLQRHPNHPMYAEVLGRIGRLEQDVFYNLSAAERALERVVGSYPNTQAANEASFDLARAALMRGDLDEARLRFNRLVDRLRTGGLAEHARFQLAQLHFFEGEFDAAQTLVDVIDANTSTDVANDAIELKLLIMENRGPDSLDVPLHRFAGVMLSKERRLTDAALDSVDALLTEFPQHALADDARFVRAELLRSGGQLQAARDAFAELPLLHPRSHLADRALFSAAEISWSEMEDRETATEMYQRLLTEYPGSLLANQARERIRQLRGDGV